MKNLRKETLCSVKDFVAELGFDSTRPSDVAFQKVACLAVACGVKLEVCEPPPELTLVRAFRGRFSSNVIPKRLSVPSPFPYQVYTPETFAESREREQRGEVHEVFGISWCRPRKIMWNSSVTRDIMDYNQRLHRQGHAEFMPSAYAVMLHELGHAAKLPRPIAMHYGVPRPIPLDEHGLNSEDVASRFGRLASRALFGVTSTEARYMQRWDSEVGQYLPPKGARMNPKPAPLPLQITRALKLHDRLFAT